MTMIQPNETASFVTAAIDDMLRVVASVKAEKHRDPLTALTDRLLEMRTAAGE